MSRFCLSESVPSSPYRFASNSRSHGLNDAGLRADVPYGAGGEPTDSLAAMLIANSNFISVAVGYSYRVIQ